MFDSFKERLGGVFAKIRGRGLLTEADVDLVMREIRIALLEADVSLPVVKTFIAEVKEQAVGEKLIHSVSPEQLIIKIVHDALVKILSGEGHEEWRFNHSPSVVLMVGLQGSGKTTSTAKLAARWALERKKVMVASLDVARPAAQEQLARLAEQAGIVSLPIIAGESPLDITKRALHEAKKQLVDVLMLDSAGRLHVDEYLMEELKHVYQLSMPEHVLLVVDAMTGQDGVHVASSFRQALDINAVMLTRIDGDARAGVALSMRHATGAPIRFLGTGEKLSDIELFHADRIASRILDMGDVVSLVEKAMATIDEKETEVMAKRLQRGVFDLNDLLSQLRNIKKMGGMKSIMNLLPGMQGLKDAMQKAQANEHTIFRQEAIILSMTHGERRDSKIINGSRRRRIAKGAGVSVQEVNILLKNFQNMQTMIKQLNKADKKGGKGSGLRRLFS
jgi:signal recognition particle subunit SRP54